MIRSRISFIYLLINVIGILVMLLIVTALFFVFFNDHGKRPGDTALYMLPVMGTVVIGMIIYGIVNYVVKTPKVVADEAAIRFNNITYLWQDIKEVKFTGKQRYFFVVIKECMQIEFVDGTKRVIFDSNYGNAWEIKSYIKQVIDKKPLTDNPVTPATFAGLASETFESFKGNPFYSFRGILIWSFIILLIYISIRDSRNALPAMAFAFSWYSLTSIWVYYFKVSDKILLVRNHHFFWLKKVYYLDDILEVAYDTLSKQPNGLRIITKDYKTKLYYAGTLDDKTWLALKAALETKGIPVRNECI